MKTFVNILLLAAAFYVALLGCTLAVSPPGNSGTAAGTEDAGDGSTGSQVVLDHTYQKVELDHTYQKIEISF